VSAHKNEVDIKYCNKKASQGYDNFQKKKQDIYKLLVILFTVILFSSLATIFLGPQVI